nr:precoat protein [Sida yellow vein Madurai virus]UZN46553.1 precoat protein [Sida yellow vein Madurai virus]
MWDPLENEFPETVHGFRSMLAVKYMQEIAKSYEPSTLGFEYVRDLISVLRCKDYVQASCKYGVFLSNFFRASKAELRQSSPINCCCPYCPRHKEKKMDQQAHESKAQILQNVSNP